MKKIIFLTVSLLSCNLMGQKVGINTEKPMSALDVNGTVSLEIVPKATSSEKVYQLLIDKKTKRITYVNEEKNFFNFVKYHVRTTFNQDWIYDCNTGIPVDKYSAILVESFFGNEYYDAKKSIHPDFIYGIRDAKNGGKLSEFVVIEPGNDNNWHIKADFFGVEPFFGSTKNTDKKNSQAGAGYFYWNFNVIYINKGLSNYLGTAESEVNNDVGVWDTNLAPSPIEYLLNKKHT